MIAMQDLYTASFTEMQTWTPFFATGIVANAECERTFSLQNRIKTNHRTGLSIDTLGKLMRVASGQDQIDSNMANDLFLLKSRRA